MLGIRVQWATHICWRDTCRIRDRYVCHLRFVHQQDRPALVVKQPSALEDDSLNVRDFYVSPMMIIQSLGEPRMLLSEYHPVSCPDPALGARSDLYVFAGYDAKK